MTGADNQQERLSVEAIPVSLGSFLAGFALGEGSFMVVCRRRDDYARKWKLSAAFNVSQKDVAPLELFRDALGCGTIRRAGNGGWYWEVNRLTDIPATCDPVLSAVSARGGEGARLRALQSRRRDPRKWRSERLGSRSGSCSPGTDEPRRKAEVLRRENPQRLYAEPCSRAGARMR